MDTDRFDVLERLVFALMDLVSQERTMEGVGALGGRRGGKWASG